MKLKYITRSGEISAKTKRAVIGDLVRVLNKSIGIPIDVVFNAGELNGMIAYTIGENIVYVYVGNNLLSFSPEDLVLI